jgi:hypothetical protein
MKKLKDLLPELVEIFGEDLRDPGLDLLDVFSGYVLLFNAIKEVFSLPEKGQREAVKLIEGFIRFRRTEGWADPYRLAIKVGGTVWRYEALRGLMIQLVQNMLEDFTDTDSSLSLFYEQFSDYSYVICCLGKIFSQQDGLAMAKALDALEEFLQGKRIMLELKESLGKIVSELNKGSKEG